MRFLIVGSTYQDFVLTVDHYPEEDEKLRAKSYQTRRGGNGANSSCVLGSLLTHSFAYPVNHSDTDTLVDFFGTFPSRQQSQWALDDFASHRVSTEKSIFYDTHQFPVAYIIQSDSTNSRTIVSYRDLPGFTGTDLIQNCCCSNDTPFYDWVHFEGNNIEATSESVAYIRHWFKNTLISLEVEKPLREGIDALIPLGDFLFFSRSYARYHGSMSAGEFLLRDLPGKYPNIKPNLIAFCTWGSEGAAVYCSDLEEKVLNFGGYHYPSSTIVETTGAGDTFIAAVIFAYSRLFDELLSSVENVGCIDKTTKLRLKLAFTLKYACFIASKKCCQKGFQMNGIIVDQHEIINIFLDELHRF